MYSGTSVPLPGVASTPWIRVCPRQIALQFQNVLREGIGGHRIAAQRPQGVLVAARRASQTKIDPARVQRFQRAELLGDGQRRSGWAA